ncbi:sigma-70 family RNA polymerase sigma factor [Oceanobacillus kimchii]|uniref:sigma-70 family RNA polymerase sigma factor n=1 Tax=Oceanobacillus kimchii TaxID=746691 RepID=UPI000346884D|nr:sigma-70 family RNA polymerase sigma factor [Oceanobacillus kimchii]
MNSQAIENWADELLEQYTEGRKDLGRMKKESPQDDEHKINSMIGSMTYSMDWMETGRQPDSYRGVDKRNAYRISQYEDMDIIPDIKEELRKEREPLYMSQEQRTTLLELFRNFSDRERQCYLMYQAEGLSMQKIAERLGISKWTVRTYINRAKEKVEEITAA